MAKRKVKKSLNTQIVIIFTLILMSTIALAWLANMLLLNRFYTKKKENSILSIYQSVESYVDNGTFGTEETDIAIYHEVSKNNAGVIVVDEANEVFKFYSSEPEKNLLREIERRRTSPDSIHEIKQEGDNYIIVEIDDAFMSMKYIELWGKLPDSMYVVVRTPIESINESAFMAMQLYTYVTLVAIVIGIFVVYFFTKRVSKPILEIADISERLANMDFDAKYTGKSKNEVGLLGNNINVLSSNLEKTILELKKANLELTKDIENKAQIDEMRKEFISNVSHELKTPIALISGYAEGLKEMSQDEASRDYYCDVIIDESARLNGMVKQLMTLNQLEFGGYDVSLEHFDVCSLIRNIAQSGEILTKDAGIKVTYPDDTVYVWADEFMIEEVIRNYYSNAVHYCMGEEKEIDFSVEMQENRVKVSVFNTGENISEEALPQLWEKFYKVDKARTREYGGSGVGLSIVKAIIEAHNQEYGVENTENGVSFWFTLDCGNRIEE